MQIKGLLVLTLTASVLAAPVALAEDTAPGAASDKTVVTDFRGRPPFARHRVETASVTDSADAQLVDAAPDADFRGRPPFSRHADSSSSSAVFARFEETDSEATAPRRYGAPGKMTSRRR